TAKKPKAVVLNGKRLTSADFKATRPEVDGALGQLTDASRPVVPERPWETPDAEKLDALSTGDWINSLPIAPLSKEMLAAQLTANNGAAVELQSQLGNLSQIKGGGLGRYWSDSERFRCRGGNDSYAKRLAEGITGDRILLKTAVKEIFTDDQ